MARISAVICCGNAGDTIEAACQSVRWADELIVVDSGSTDGTASIAKKYADRFLIEPWRGYTHQKRFAVGLSRNDWVISLDSDEECSPVLAQELEVMTDAQINRYDLLLVPRKNYVMGRYVRAWWPDLSSRVFHHRRCTWDDEALHDVRRPGDPARVSTLRGWIEHKRHSQAGFGDYFSGRRLDERLMMVAQQMHRQGKRAHSWDLLIRPWVAFAKFYLFKRGFLDGAFGLLIAQKAAVSTQLKYAALWAIQHGLTRPTPLSQQSGQAPTPDADGQPQLAEPAASR